jgi:glycosyltransferase involved in cell wall biosynthesis
MPVADLLPNGVDTVFYHPLQEPVTPRTAIFWGRLDFEPNVDALVWFARHVWPTVVRQVPDARFTIVGYSPTPDVEVLTRLPNVTLYPNVEDLRQTACQHAIVVLPMISGGGIKNKLLEGAAMGRPIVCTPRACLDLRSNGRLPVVLSGSAADFASQMIALWNDAARQEALGREARAWVREYYSWTTPAKNALAGFEEGLKTRARRPGVPPRPAAD